jgi:hypothetical protein
MISTGAGESLTERASLLEPTATTSSTSSAPNAKEGRVGVKIRANAKLNPLISLVLYIFMYPKLLKKVLPILIFQSQQLGKFNFPF